MDNQSIVKLALQHVLTPGTGITEIEQYFSHNYQQTVNGQLLYYSDFVKHIELLQQILTSVRIEIIAMAENDNVVFTHHHVFATKQGGHKIHTQVMAQFTLSDNKIIQCNELTRLVLGGEHDHDLGSRID